MRKRGSIHTGYSRAFCVSMFRAILRTADWGERGADPSVFPENRGQYLNILPY